MSEDTCPFCSMPASRIAGQNAHALWIRDGFPVSPGHSLVIPRRHVGSFFETNAEEREALMELLNQAKSVVEEELQPDGYNVGINDGLAAGQTVPHLHTVADGISVTAEHRATRNKKWSNVTGIMVALCVYENTAANG